MRSRSERRFRLQLVWGAGLLLYSLVQAATEPPGSVSASPTALPQRTKDMETPLTTPGPPVIAAGAGGSSSPRPTVLSKAAINSNETAAPGVRLPTSGAAPSVPATSLVVRSNCTPPAIEQFPRPILGPSARKHGALLIHILVCIYSFIGLAIVCDDYFVTSLDRICEVLRLTPDVAGATFMAAGSSAPELATVVIGVFFAKDDIGVSGVIGSAVFNIMFVIAICAIFGGTVSYLNWWPLCRDSFFYLISILIMFVVIFDEVITWGESIFMLIVYCIYCVCLSYNGPLEKWAHTLPVPCKEIAPQGPQATAPPVPSAPPASAILESEDQRLVSYRTLEERDNYNATGQQDPPTYGGGAGSIPNGGGKPAVPPPPNLRPEYYKAKEQTNQVSPLIKPETTDQMTLLQWHLCYPIHYTAQKTMPDCKSEQYKNWYPFTFLISMIWISFYSYIMVWMITIIGNTLGIPDTVMGLTFVAAGVSVPDALSSLAVVKEGYGDMAVSNAVGSNVFDILICLGLPWFMKTAVIKPGTTVKVYSKGLTYSTLTLLSTVVFLVSVTHANGWKMDKRYGLMLLSWYLIFICCACLYELNVFGDWNQPECSSDY